jgi:hypothetical protein
MPILILNCLFIILCQLGWMTSSIPEQSLDISGPMFKSYDSGVTWVDISQGLSSQLVSAITIDPLSPNVIYAGTDRGIFKSTDAGGHWIRPDNLSSLFAIENIVISPSNPSVIYATNTQGIQARGILKSKDAGTTWEIISAGKYQGEKILPEKIFVDPANPSTLYIQAKSGIFKSTNDGKKWTIILPLPAPENGADYPRDIKLAALAPSTLYVVGINKVFKTTDGGNTWTDLTRRLKRSDDQIPNEDDLFLTVTIDPANPLVIYLGGVDWLYKSLDGGNSWLAMKNPNAIAKIKIDPSTPSTLYSTSYEKVFKSIDAGITLFEVQFPKAYFLDLGFDPITPSILYLGASMPQFTKPWIYGFTIEDDRLIVGGVNFDEGAVILLDGIEQATKHTKVFPTYTLIGKKAGKKIRINPDLKIQVRNSNGETSQELRFGVLGN